MSGPKLTVPWCKGPLLVPCARCISRALFNSMLSCTRCDARHPLLKAACARHNPTPARGSAPDEGMRRRWQGAGWGLGPRRSVRQGRWAGAPGSGGKGRERAWNAAQVCCRQAAARAALRCRPGRRLAAPSLRWVAQRPLPAHGASGAAPSRSCPTGELRDLSGGGSCAPGRARGRGTVRGDGR